MKLGQMTFFWCLLALIVVGNGQNHDMAQKCGQVAQSVIPCLEYATGKANTPSPPCCIASASIRKDNPVCMCYIIQQIHDGNPQVKSMGIQEPRLLGLPAACNQNGNTTQCPALLGLSPNSPEAAIFKNSSHATPSTSSASSTTSPSSSPQSRNNPSSHETMLRPSMFIELMVMALAIVLYAIPNGYLRIYM